MFRQKIITRAIWLLSLVSFFTDIASEMLYPVMPVYLRSIGFSVVLIGILEGVAEATAGLSKGYFGKLSDIKGRRLPFVQAGYFFSALSKPMMALFVFPAWVFLARTIDRLGKGIRTGARDAMLSDETTPEHKAKVFGFHRSLDTLGAVLGPLGALLFLHYYPGAYQPLFYLAFIPGMLGVTITLLLREKTVETPAAKSNPSFLAYLSYWKESPAAYRRLVCGLLCFTLFNSSDVFLLLMLKQQGVTDTNLILVYVFYNLVYALFSYPVGIIADKVGLRYTLTTGFILFSLVYAGMGFSHSMYVYYGLFFLYGLYAASTEGIAKAWISNISARKDTATAIGTFSAFNSICTLLASSLAGVLWYTIGPAATFLVSAAGALLIAIYFLVSKPA